MWESGQDRAPGHDDVNCEGGCLGEKRARHLERPEFYVMVPALSIHPRTNSGRARINYA
jgi:hypothetical protein